MACKCSPCLTTLRAELDARFPGRYPNLGCCGDLAHSKRTSDHNPATAPPESAGYAHALDVGEDVDHGMDWLRRQIFDSPDAYPQVKYLIYERELWYPHNGARPRGKYPYTGPNPHATHLHISIFTTHTHDRRSWLDIGEEDIDMAAKEEILARIQKADEHVSEVKDHLERRGDEQHNEVLRRLDALEAAVKK